jgi:predicted outer membrane repeat protein
VFEDNEATSGDGGAIWADSSPIVIVQRCSFRRNVAAGHGGAIHHEETYFDGIWIDGSDFETNSAGGNGGAIHSGGSRDEIYGSYVAGCRFEGNEATNGGAVHVGGGYGGSESFFSVTHNVFLGNTATQNGGALWLRDTWQSEDGGPVARNLFARNSAGGNGGAMVIVDGIRMSYSTFVDNGAASGGHLWVQGGWLRLYDSILAFATAGGAAGGTAACQTGCLDVYENLGGNYVGPLAGQIGVATNFSADPLFCNAAADDYTLRENSPCAPPGATGCGLIGVYDVGCGPVSVEPTSWGLIKARYR